MTRFAMGTLWGAVATLAMSVLMILGLVTGVAPMPKPIPAAIVGRITGGGLAKPALMATAAILHVGTVRSGAVCSRPRRVASRSGAA